MVVHDLVAFRYPQKHDPKAVRTERATLPRALKRTRKICAVSRYTKQDIIEKFVVETMLIAEGRPCPPVVLGVGIGGTFDGAAVLAKEALLLPIDQMNPYEQQICNAVNRLRIGPMGLGGDTTVLSVKVKTAACHTASLPVAVNVQCWACRRATVEVKWR